MSNSRILQPLLLSTALVLAAPTVLAKQPDPSGGLKVTAAVERKARSIEKLLIAPCCYKGTLEDHASGVANNMRKEIRMMLMAGQSKSQILAHYRKKYGQAVLAEPPKGGLSGFILYGVPFGLAFIGLILMTVLMARRRRQGEADSETPVLPEDHELPPEMEARIDALVKEGPAR